MTLLKEKKTRVQALKAEHRARPLERATGRPARAAARAVTATARRRAAFGGAEWFLPNIAHQAPATVEAVASKPARASSQKAAAADDWSSEEDEAKTSDQAKLLVGI